MRSYLIAQLSLFLALIIGLIQATDVSQCTASIEAPLNPSKQIDYTTLEACLPTITQVYFVDQIITKLPANMFTKMLALNNIIVKRCSFTSLDETFFGLTTAVQGQNLTDFSVSANQISTVNVNTFQMVHGLTKLNMADNKISTLATGTFAGLDKLEQLNMNGNQLKAIDENLLKDLVNLESLDLGSNKLEQFSTASLKTNSKLQKLLLQKNQIKEFTVPEVMNNITYFDLQYNLLTAVPDLEKLTSLSILLLSHNKLKLFDASFNKVPKSLTQLYLSNVNFAAAESANPFEMFASLSNLYSLSIGRNGITELDFTKFPKLSKLNTLMLYDNEFTSIDFTNVKTKLPKLDNIGLSQKTWTCEKVANMLESLASQNINQFFYKASYKVFGIGNNIENIGCVNENISKVLEKQFKSLKQQNADLEANLKAMTKKMSDSETEIQASKTTVQKLKEQVNDLRSENKNLETYVEVIKTDMEAAIDKIKDSEKMIEKLDVDIVYLKKEVDYPSCVKYDKCKFE